MFWGQGYGKKGSSEGTEVDSVKQTDTQTVVHIHDGCRSLPLETPSDSSLEFIQERSKRE